LKGKQIPYGNDRKKGKDGQEGQICHAPAFRIRSCLSGLSFPQGICFWSFGLPTKVQQGLKAHLKINGFHQNPSTEFFRSLFNRCLQVMV
jgi:hypothetical protein